jgi:hypothetical protein
MMTIIFKRCYQIALVSILCIQCRHFSIFHVYIKVTKSDIKIWKSVRCCPLILTAFNTCLPVH